MEQICLVSELHIHTVLYSVQPKSQTCTVASFPAAWRAQQAVWQDSDLVWNSVVGPGQDMADQLKRAIYNPATAGCHACSNYYPIL